VQPSLLAAACLAASCQGLVAAGEEEKLLQLASYLPASLLRSHAGQISVLVEHLEMLLDQYSTARYRDVPAAVAVPATSSGSKYQTAGGKYREEGTTTPTDCHMVAEIVAA
jgi:hypothetical protein